MAQILSSRGRYRKCISWFVAPEKASIIIFDYLLHYSILVLLFSCFLVNTVFFFTNFSKRKKSRSLIVLIEIQIDPFVRKGIIINFYATDLPWVRIFSLRLGINIESPPSSCKNCKIKFRPKQNLEKKNINQVRWTCQSIVREKNSWQTFQQVKFFNGYKFLVFYSFLIRAKVFLLIIIITYGLIEQKNQFYILHIEELYWKTCTTFTPYLHLKEHYLRRYENRKEKNWVIFLTFTKNERFYSINFFLPQ